jgi:predicted dehydrogenase
MDQAVQEAMMAERVRVGVIGTSMFAELLHLEYLAADERVELAAICGRNQERAAEVARKYGIPRVFADWREMLDRTALDAVVIVTPDDLHYPMAMAALERGLHVLCEKSLANTAAQAREMYEAAERKRVKHMTMFTARWFPGFRYARRLVEEGYLGGLYHATFREFGGGWRQPRYRWRRDARRGNGVLGDIGSHKIDMARWLCDDIAAVAAHTGSYVAQPGPDGEPVLATPANDSAMLLVRFTRGAHGSIHVSNVAHPAVGSRAQVHALHGANGTLEIADTAVRGARGDEKTVGTLELPPDIAGGVDLDRPLLEWAREYFLTQPVGDRAFLEAIVHDHPAAPSFYDGWKAQQVVDAALESSRTGRWVTIGDAPDP